MQVTFGGHVHDGHEAPAVAEVLLTRRVDSASEPGVDSEELALLRSADRDPVLRVDAEGVLRFANAAAKPLLDHWKVHPGQKLPVTLRELIALARARGTPLTHEVEASGRVTELRVVAPAGLDQSVIYGRDVTEQRATQRALQESEARKRLLIEASLDAVVTMDHDGRIVDWSPRATELFGWSEKEAVGATMSSMIVPDRHRAAHEAGLRHFLRSGEGPVLGRRIEVPAVLRSGEEIPVELFIRVLHADDGEPPLFAGFVRDVREQKKASDQLIEANSRLSALIRSTSSGVLVLSDEGRITLVNDPFREMFGLEASTEDLLGADGVGTLEDIAGQTADPDSFVIPEPGAEEADAERGVEEFTLHDGRIFEREYSTVRSDQQVLGHMWQFRDITDRRRTEAAVRRARNAEVRLGGQIQDLFLRGRPPERHPHLDIAVLSVPSQGLDGDFVDFIEHGANHLDVVVGDVMGKGLAASLLGAATKNSFARALTSASRSGVDLPPTTEVVSRVHEALARRLISVDSFVTLLYSRLDLQQRVIELVGCGHPGVIHYSPATRSHSILNGQDPPIGFVKENEYTALRVPFEVGDLLVFYSDGITEAFSPGGEMLGVQRLLDTVKAAEDQPASGIVRDVRQLIDDFTGVEGAPKDDLTLVVVRVRRSRVSYGGDVHEMLLHRGRTRLFEMRSFLHEVIAGAYPTADEAFSAEVVRAAQEAVTNALRHARPEDPEAPILVRAEVTPQELVVEVRYDGVAFEPDAVALPDLSTYPEGGFGLYVIEHSVDDVSYGIAADGRSLIRMVKRLPGA